jgi:hypothetical protein
LTDSHQVMSLEIPVSLDLLPQIQHRLHRLTSQLDQMQARLDQLTSGAQDNNIQLDALLQTMLTPHAVQTVDERLAELTVQLDSTHEQIAQMREALSTVATQEQVSSLERALAGRDLLADVADSVKKLGRTQFKANTLGDTREQQIESALALARELVTRREQLQERRSADDRLRLEELRSTARGDFAADLLPALDSIELALDAGQSLLARHRQQVEIWRAHYAAMQRDWQATHSQFHNGCNQHRAIPRSEATWFLAAFAPQPGWRTTDGASGRASRKADCAGDSVNSTISASRA